MKKLLLALAVLLCANPLHATTTFINPGGDATQSVAGFFGANTNATISSTVSYTGPSSIELNVGSPAATASVTAYNVLADTGSCVTLRMRFQNNLPSVKVNIIVARNTSDQNVYLVTLSTAGKLGFTGNTAADGPTVLSASTWYRIAVCQLLNSTSSYTVKIFLNGVLELTGDNMNNGNLPRVGSNRLHLQENTGFGANNSVWLDDIYINDSSALTDPGDIRCTAKFPITNGTSNAFTTEIGMGPSMNGASGCAGHSCNVSELPLSVSYGWQGTGAGSPITEEYSIQGLSSGQVDLTGKTIVDYGGFVYVSSATTPNASIMLNGSSSGTIALSTTQKVFTKFAGSSAYPAGTGTDIGLVSDTSIATFALYEAGVVFAYLNGSAATPHNLSLLGVGR